MSGEQPDRDDSWHNYPRIKVTNQTSGNVTSRILERPGTDVILGCDFCDRQVETYRPQKRVVEFIACTANPSERARQGVHKSWFPSQGDKRLLLLQDVKAAKYA